MPHLALPARLGHCFTVAEALREGVTYGSLRNRELERPFHGIRSLSGWVDASIQLDRFGLPRSAAAQSMVRRALEYATRMPAHEFFSHVTAAVLWCIPLPPVLLIDRDIDVSVLAPRRPPRGRGVRGHQAVPALTGIRSDPVTGLTLASPATTWATLGGMTRDQYDLVAAGDAIVREWRVQHPLANVADLDAVIAAGRRVGIGRLRAALPRVRTRSASRPESHARLTLVDAGMPEPALNFEVIEGGTRLAHVDLAYPEHKVAIEYEGEHHLLDPRQWARDIVRYERLAAAGWHVVRVTKTELFGDPRTFVRRVRAALAGRS